MPLTHPLELVEILSLVAAYLPLESLPACTRVSKTWYQACVPLIWSDIHLGGLSRCSASIQKNKHLVKRVNIGYVWRKELASLSFSNLDSICLDVPELHGGDTIQFIMEHPTVTRLELKHLASGQPAFWDALLGFRNLRSLSMSSLEIFGTNMDKFWQLCARLERLDIMFEHNPSVTLPPGDYPNLRHLGMSGRNPDMASFFIRFLRQCPCLTSIAWRTQIFLTEAFLSRLSELFEAKALPCLEYLDAGTGWIGNGLLTRLIRSLPPRIKALLFGFSRTATIIDFETVFQPCFSTIRVLEAAADINIKLPFAQIAMSSCPLLEKLKAPIVDALVVTEGKPWVCLRLKVLELAFCFDPPGIAGEPQASTIGHLQPLIFDRLSKLTRLEELRMTGPDRQYGPCGKVDLRLEIGLDKLSTLWLLRSIDLYNVLQCLGDAEVDWISEHWKSLTLFRGRLFGHGNAVSEAWGKRLNRHGIKVV
ncbi:MAG: hypothetical protein J3Q66DRAFT_437640 [Benniella sp.]|nr:MAG: hypothetical protein J3Q66DRAFT_437640 [Benniella sp.]